VDKLAQQYHILTGTDGIYHNVIKIKPPLCINSEDVDYFLDSLENVISKYAVVHNS
jgi:4-aminobutyrate aminotransferase-like enzyme